MLVVEEGEARVTVATVAMMNEPVAAAVVVIRVAIEDGEFRNVKGHMDVKNVQFFLQLFLVRLINLSNSGLVSFLSLPHVTNSFSLSFDWVKVFPNESRPLIYQRKPLCEVNHIYQFDFLMYFFNLF